MIAKFSQIPMPYKKIIIVIVLTCFLLLICYLTMDIEKVNVQNMQKYFFPNKELIINFSKDNIDNSTKIISNVQPHNIRPHNKFKIHFENEEEFKNKTKNKHEDETVYYFPIKCPSYKLGFYILDNVNGFEKYYVPEEGYVIFTGKNHKWLKQPDFLYWKN